MAATITAGIIARDEERHIADCIGTLAWADEVIVLVDAASTDRTRELARANGARVEEQHFVDFPSMRQVLLNLVTSEWIFFVDADERVTPRLADEIRQVVAQRGLEAPVGFWVPRRNLIWGRWIRGGGWFPDHQLRLFRRDRARYDLDRRVHELVLLDGPAGNLSEPLTHINYETVNQFIAKQSRYSTLEAETMLARGERARPHNFVLQPLREFRRRYVTLGGYRDGIFGLALSTLLAYYVFVTYLNLWRFQRAVDRPGQARGARP